MNKKGISLLILVVTVIVLSILVSATIVGIDNAIEETKKVSFVEEITSIKEIVSVKLNTGKTLKDICILDTVSNPVIKTKEDILNLLQGNDKKKSDFNLEVSSSKLYMLDLSKLETSASKKGFGKNTDVLDNYYLQIKEVGSEIILENVIYPKGIRIGKKYYFSSNNELFADFQDKDVVGNQEINQDLVNETGLLKITKITNTDEYTNEIKYKIVGIANANVTSLICENRQISVDTTDNTFVLNKAKLGNVKVEDKLKLKSGQNVAVVDVRKLDIENPVIASVNSNVVDGLKEVEINASDDKSGICKYKYVDITGKVSSLTYVDTVGKESKNNIIELPSNTTKIGVVVEDRAGNKSYKEFNI